MCLAPDIAIAKLLWPKWGATQLGEGSLLPRHAWKVL
jgi:hypothetical protein